jgi:Putative glutamine amidotransferase
MAGSILYMGDTSLDTAAAYLAGLMMSWGWEFEYFPSDEDLPAVALEPTWSLFIISDYPARRVSQDRQWQIIARVHGGTGLLMIGGWESFHGLGGDWDGSPLAEILPVHVGSEDDRVNCDHPVFVRPSERHPIAAGLPWDDRPPLIGGLNRVHAKSDSTTVLTAEHFRAGYRDNSVELVPTLLDPLLVVGDHGVGRTAAFMTDVAPHWVGPLVDWGPERVVAQAPGAPEVEVGSLYAQFLRQLLTWTSGAE